MALWVRHTQTSSRAASSSSRPRSSLSPSGRSHGSAEGGLVRADQWLGSAIRWRDWLLGILLGLPFAFPSEPFYLLAGLAFLMGVPTQRLPVRETLLCVALMAVAALSVTLSPV